MAFLFKVFNLFMLINFATIIALPIFIKFKLILILYFRSFIL